MNSRVIVTLLFAGLFAPVVGAQPDSSDDEALRAEVEALRALLKQHHLDTVRTATGSAENTWRWRFYW